MVSNTLIGVVTSIHCHSWKEESLIFHCCIKYWLMKILLVDDHILFREGLASLIDTQSELTVAGFADSIQDAIIQTNSLQPDLVLMDFNLPDGNGIHYTQQVLDQHPQIKVVFLTTSTDDNLLHIIVENEAIGHLRKNTPVEDLLSYINDLKRGETTFSRSNFDS
jgi:DNA-binding NarL/FixJ family response regulator